jgi:DNA repair exonuclease SbcCD ATPase subunit
MEEETSDFEEQTTSIVKVEEMSLEETQVAEQLYNSAGLDPVVDAGLKDYDKRIQVENKLINKVLGTRGSDIRGYGEAVAKRVAVAIYDQLNRQYGGKVGDLRSYLMSLEEDRDRANIRYDELMGRVIGILGDEYKALRTDSNAFMEKLTTLLGEDIEASKIDQRELTERLADIDGLRTQIQSLSEEKKQQKDSSEAEVAAQKKEHADELKKLQAQITRLETKIERLEAEKSALNQRHSEEQKELKAQISSLDTKTGKLEAEKTTLSGDLKKLGDDHRQLVAAISKLVSVVPDEEMGKKMSEELYDFVLKDSKVPDVVIEGVGKFTDFKKYLGEAVERGAREVSKRVEETLNTVPGE